MSAPVKLFGRRPHEGLATRTGAGVRKAAEDETARWERQAVRQTLNRAPHASVSRVDFEAGGLSMMQRKSCGMDVAKRGVFTFCAFNDFNGLGVAKRAQTQLLRELLCCRPLIHMREPIS